MHGLYLHQDGVLEYSEKYQGVGDLNLEQISSATLSNLQMLLDQQKLPLAVGPITDSDYQAMTTAFADLNWDFAFSQFGNSPEKFEFSVKLIEATSPLPAGAAMCTYNIEENSFHIQFVESFVRGVRTHPLHGNMLIITMLAAYLFCSAVECDNVYVIEPMNAEVMKLYSTFGFSGNDILMTASIAQIREAVLRYT